MIQHTWVFNWPMVIVAVILLIIMYRINKSFRGKSGFFITGVIFLLLVTVSPLDPAGHHYLFSAHMVQHIFLLLIVPPLLLMGLDGTRMKDVNVTLWLKRTGDFIFHPVTAWIIGMATMWFWHIPPVFQSMKGSNLVHFIHLTSLLVAGVIFIWPVHSPVQWRKLSSPLISVLYLFMACVGCTILGILLTFSKELYFVQSFIYTSNEWLPEGLKMTPATDQQVAGLIMWVPACAIYIINSMIILGRWLKTPEPDLNE